MAVNPKPIILCLSESGATLARKIAKDTGFAIHGRIGRVKRADAFFTQTTEHIASLFCAGIPIIGICAAGILIRALAPHLRDKQVEPPVLALSEDGKSIAPLLGGHHGANALAQKLATILNGHPALTTAGEVAFGIALDEPPAGWRLGNPQDAASFMASLLAERAHRVALDMQVETPAIKSWLAELPCNNVPCNSVSDDKKTLKITCTDKPITGDKTHLVFHPQNLVLGLGCIRGAEVEEVFSLLTRCLKDANLSPFCIAAIGSLDLKADEPALIQIAARLTVPYRLFTATQCEGQKANIATPSAQVFKEVGCHSVCEASALLLSNGGRLILPKQKSQNATCAIAKTAAPITEFHGRSRGQLALIGIGPGQESWRTPEASRLIAQADELVGYSFYIDLLGAAAAHKPRKDFPLGAEEDRVRYALQQAGTGKNIALICSGDSGIYAMGALAFELLDKDPTLSDGARRTEVISAPGISALQAAAARIGAPLGHDFCAISLSDLLTPRGDILKRLNAAATGDFVLALYNPVSKTRQDLLRAAREILLKHRAPDTPVLIARALGRPDESLRIIPLSKLTPDGIDMMCLVMIGAKNTRAIIRGEGTHLYTPRGYSAKKESKI